MKKHVVRCGLSLWLAFESVAAFADQPAESAQDAQPAASATPDVGSKRFRLANGLDVLLQVDRSRPRVGIALSFGSGHADDPPGLEGLARVTQRALFEASADVAPYRRLLDQMGATHDRATISATRTTHALEVPRSALSHALGVEAERVALVLDVLNEASVARARKSVANEKEYRRRGALGPLPDVYALMYGPRAPVARDGHSEVARIALDHVRWFVQQYYRPDDAKLVLVGDFDTSAAEALVRRAFDPWKAHKRWAPRASSPPSTRLQRSVTRANHQLIYLRRMIALGWPVGEQNPKLAESLAVVATAVKRALEGSTFLFLHASFVDDDVLDSDALVLHLVLPVEMSYDGASRRISELLINLCSAPGMGNLGAALANRRLDAALHRDEYGERATAIARRSDGPVAYDLGAVEASYGQLDASEVAATCRKWLLDKPRAELRTGPP